MFGNTIRWITAEELEEAADPGLRNSHWAGITQPLHRQKLHYQKDLHSNCKSLQVPFCSNIGLIKAEQVYFFNANTLKLQVKKVHACTLTELLGEFMLLWATGPCTCWKTGAWIWGKHHLWRPLRQESLHGCLCSLVPSPQLQLSCRLCGSQEAL